MLTPLSSSSKDIWQMLTGALWGGTWLFAVCVLLSLFVLRWWPGDRLLIVRLINYSMPWFLAVLLPMLLMAGATNRKWLLLSLALSSIYILCLHLPLFLPKSPPPAPPAAFKLKVMSFNVWSRNSDILEVVRVIKQENPDLLLLQELPAKDVKQIATQLAGVFPGPQNNFLYDPKKLLATFSRYPLTLRNSETKSSVQKVLVQTPVGLLTVYNIHLLRSVLRHGDHWKRLHERITGLVSKEIADISGPVIIAGDFNLTDQTETYRQISSYLKNSHSQAGSGFGFTFPSGSRKFKGLLTLPPLVRIDHLFYNDSLFVIKAATLTDSGGSDHLPIVAEFWLPARQ